MTRNLGILAAGLLVLIGLMILRWTSDTGDADEERVEEQGARGQPELAPEVPPPEPVPEVSGTAPTVPGFTYLRHETFSGGGQTHTVAIYRCDAFAKAIGLEGGETAVDVEFVLVPGRVVDLGSLASDPLPPGWSRSPRRRRAVPGFLIARTETTRRVWHGLAEGAEAQAGPSWHASDNVPVEQVSWIDAARWCEATGLCLPTEDMWETACQAGMDGVAATIQDHAWHAPSPGDDIHDVATRKPDAIGLFDILGNVSEWTADRWLDDGGQPEDESGSSEDDLRPYRGGSAFDAEEECSCSLRRASRASNRHEGHLGFRAAHMLE